MGIAALYRLNIVREVQGRITSTGLRPESYAETRNGKLKRSVRFDWSQKQATLFNGEASKVVPLPERTWDTTSFGYNFAYFRQQSGELQVNLTDGRKISSNRYALLAASASRRDRQARDAAHEEAAEHGRQARVRRWLAVDRHLRRCASVIPRRTAPYSIRW